VENGFSTSRSHIRDILLLAKSVIRTPPDYLAIASFVNASAIPGSTAPDNGEKFMKLFSKDHIRSTPGSAAHGANLRFMDVCQDYASLGHGRRWFLTAFVALIDQSKSAAL
jgi:hypothetical protein